MQIAQQLVRILLLNSIILVNSSSANAFIDYSLILILA